MSFANLPQGLFELCPIRCSVTLGVKRTNDEGLIMCLWMET
ncbi:hypothetical protein Hanom_Chr17g01555991 [Helianthus anomalus]